MRHGLHIEMVCSVQTAQLILKWQLVDVPPTGLKETLITHPYRPKRIRQVLVGTAKPPLSNSRAPRVHELPYVARLGLVGGGPRILTNARQRCSVSLQPQAPVTQAYMAQSPRHSYNFL